VKFITRHIPRQLRIEENIQHKDLIQPHRLMLWRAHTHAIIILAGMGKIVALKSKIILKYMYGCHILSHAKKKKGSGLSDFDETWWMI
jgi:hypothetical protein